MKLIKRCLCSGLIVLLPGLVSAAPPLPPEKFEAIRLAVKPRPGEEKWNDIRWLSDLWEARRQAAAAGKPIFLWEMDGHPLACT